MLVDIRPCDIYDLNYVFFEKGQTVLLKNNIKSISYKMAQYSFCGVKNIISNYNNKYRNNCCISKNFVHVLPTSL